jgi:NADH-quinone oxidoreductase subunit H
MMLFADPLFGLPAWLDAVIRIVIVVLAMTVIVVYSTYGERKLVARFQQRLGPMRTGPWGLWQGFADALKLVGKEDIRPKNADRWVFELAPYATFIPVLLTLMVLPFAENWGVRNLALGVFFVFAVLGLNIVGILMAGLGSGNKYALLGGIRAAAQMISYEIPLVVSLLCVVMITGADTGNGVGTLNLNTIAALQQDRPYIVLQPLAFLIFFTAMLSELHRAPFDIPVAESEIVGGYFVEYSGIRWSMFQLTEYASMWGFAVFGSVVFLGGWAWPFGVDSHWAVQLATTFTKALAIVVVIIWIRTTVPRLRIDQLMNFSWKVLLELSFLQLVVNGIILYYEWPQELLALTSALGAAFLIFLIIRHASARSTKGLLGTYRTLGASSS